MPDTFQARLNQALRSAAGAAPPRDAAPAMIPASQPAAASSAFQQRLDQAMRRARGEPPSPSDAPTSAPQAAGPVGRGDVLVREGDSIESIAHDTGFFYETIWNLPDNQELRQIRISRNILLQGDRVTLPDKTRKDVPITAEQRHRFKRRGCPAYLALRLLNDEEPLANQPYTLTIGEIELTGFTDPEGKLKHPIPPNARRARLVVGPDEQTYELDIGVLDPISEISGVQQRLVNLGFRRDPPTGKLDALTRQAVREFQDRAGLPVTGDCDPPTIARLEELHDRTSPFPPEEDQR